MVEFLSQHCFAPKRCWDVFIHFNVKATLRHIDAQVTDTNFSARCYVDNFFGEEQQEQLACIGQLECQCQWTFSANVDVQAAAVDPSAFRPRHEADRDAKRANCANDVD
ncbi:uncharacterized protein IUM83_16507 [Phytophthora cinnamomi]|uniref:uncharacterized protein n=1 Tax=Phytophthora cinnamomi TaxID=4785 RepID=UPI003559BCAC|nr:hypothetical protein IUM83_16507 [Phytophthora cinnamomi]